MRTLRGDGVVMVTIGVMSVVALVWNAFVGIVFRTSFLAALATALPLFVISAIFRRLRPNRLIAEVALYVGLWTLQPVVGVRLTYLANAIGVPLCDHALSAADAAIGFHWVDWARFVVAHPWLLRLNGLAYESYVVQPLLSIFILARWGRPGANRELLSSILIAFNITTFVSIFTPAIGPADAVGFVLPPAGVIHAIRSHATTPLDYVGIVSFPSFHTVMAVLFTLAHRNGRVARWFFAALNVAMLLSTPYAGAHYLVDVFGGIVVALLSFLVSRRLYAWSGRDVAENRPAKAS